MNVKEKKNEKLKGGNELKKNKIIYCSQCKHSKYVKHKIQTNNKNMLHCERYEDRGLGYYMPTDAQYAQYCPFLEPEKFSQKLLKNDAALRYQISEMDK